MIICPECHGSSSVIDTRSHANTVKRKRRCDVCQHKWTTIEVSTQFMSFASELPSLINHAAELAQSIRTAVDDYDLHAFGETDAIGRKLPVRTGKPICPRCQSTRCQPITDDNYKKPRYQCLDCHHEGTELAFKKKRH